MILRVPAVAAVLFTIPCLLAACSSSGSSGDGDFCDVEFPTGCPSVDDLRGGDYAQFCALSFGEGVCTNVCDFASNQVGGGDLDDFCVFDSDCNDGLTCDNDTVGAEQPCHCVPDEGGSGNDCADVTPGDGNFGAPCRNDGDCAEGLPCCTSTAVSEACGVEVGLCECI